MVNTKTNMINTKSHEDNITVAKKGQEIHTECVESLMYLECNLKKVYYIPDLKRNLLSVHEITKNDCTVVFNNNGAKVLKDDCIISKGKTENGFYVVDLKTENEVLSVDKENFCMYLSKLSNLCEDIPKMNIKEVSKNLCEVCIHAKQTRLPFKSVRKGRKRILDMVHTDVCGPIDIETHDGKKYFVTFLNDFSHFCVVYLLPSKNEVTKYIKEFVSQSESRSDQKLNNLRYDNGGEYRNGQLKEWCKNKGITLDYAVPYTPQLNGKAEKLNRTHVEKARAMLFDSNLDSEIWGEATLNAAYLLNRSPTLTIDMTPAEKWYGKKPDMNKIKLFGCRAYTKKLNQLKKFESRTIESIFVGYTDNGYRLWNPEKREIFAARDVVFNENEEFNKNEK
jgi:hypothetical protein